MSETLTLEKLVNICAAVNSWEVPSHPTDKIYTRTVSRLHVLPVERPFNIVNIHDHYIDRVKKLDRLRDHQQKYSGLNIVVNDEMCVFYAPSKNHRKTKRMSDRYHRRVQKKWNKRFGLVRNDHSYFVKGMMYVSSRVLNELKNGQGYETD